MCYKPSRTPQETLVEVEVGSDIALSCPAAGSPTPVVMWRKMGEGQALPDGAYQSRDNQLKIIRAITEDSGQYQCSAKNSVGLSWSEPIRLSVISTCQCGGAFTNMSTIGPPLCPLPALLSAFQQAPIMSPPPLFLFSSLSSLPPNTYLSSSSSNPPIPPQTRFPTVTRLSSLKRMTELAP